MNELYQNSNQNTMKENQQQFYSVDPQQQNYNSYGAPTITENQQLQQNYNSYSTPTITHNQQQFHSVDPQQQNYNSYGGSTITENQQLQQTYDNPSLKENQQDYISPPTYSNNSNNDFNQQINSNNQSQYPNNNNSQVYPPNTYYGSYNSQPPQSQSFYDPNINITTKISDTSQPHPLEFLPDPSYQPHLSYIPWAAPPETLQTQSSPASIHPIPRSSSLDRGFHSPSEVEEVRAPPSTVSSPSVTQPIRRGRSSTIVPTKKNISGDWKGAGTSIGLSVGGAVGLIVGGLVGLVIIGGIGAAVGRTIGRRKGQSKEKKYLSTQDLSNVKTFPKIHKSKDPRCCICSKKFSPLVQRGHCSLCGRSFCRPHIPHRAYILFMGETLLKFSKVCESCWNDNVMVDAENHIQQVPLNVTL